MKRKPRVVVIGAGIVGAAMAWHLARAGAAVALLESARPAAGATGRAFAWINVAHGAPQPGRLLRQLAVEEWRRMEPTLGDGLSIDWCGALTWTDDASRTERFAREHVASGYDVQLLERDAVARREPDMIDPPQVAAFVAGEGALDPLAATEALLAGARAAGAEVHFDCPVVALETRAGAVTGVRTGAAVCTADTVVLAAGTGSVALASGIGVSLPVRSSPAILLRYGRAGRFVRSIVSGPDLEVRQDAGGRVFGAEDMVEGVAPETVAADALAALRRHFRGTESITVESVEVGWRPMPGDGLPVIGFAPGASGLYLAVLHAGITLAPAVGRFATEEILHGTRAAALDGCHPERFGG